MKAFFSRLHLGSSNTKEKDTPPIKEKLPPLKPWPPQNNSSPKPEYSSVERPLPPIEHTESLSASISGIQSSSSSSSTTPTPPSKSSTPVPDDPPQESSIRATSPRQEPDSTGRSSRKNANGVTSPNGHSNDIQKKVAFMSPSPSQTIVDRGMPDSPGSPTFPPSSPPLKNSVSRFQATHGKEPRGSTTSTGASSSKTDLGSTSKGSAMKASSMRTTSPYSHRQAGASAQSLRSGTPYSQMSDQSGGSRILQATSWSQVTEEDLVVNIGSRERTRQEVLFEIIQSEERYVQELAKMKETFIDPLLHPYSSSSTIPPLSSTPNLEYDYYRSESPSAESADHLPPIAARFMSPTPSIPSRHKDTPNMDGDSESDDDDAQLARRSSARRPGNTSAASKHDHPRSPYRSNAPRIATKPSGGTVVPFPSRSHHSLPPPPRAQFNSSTHSLGRQSPVVERDQKRERNYSQGQSTIADRKGEQPKGMLRKLKKSESGRSGSVLGDTVAPHSLPEDLRICLEVIDGGVFDGHKRLSEALKKRYDEQFPLVRSLADVFVANSDIFAGYAKYVLHLERALEQVDAALSNVSTKKPKNQDVAEWQKVCSALQKLEENASEKGETGLAITLSKPFQRLLKYPLLFQNLLFHTDPSTYEYESTLQMVAEVESIVRSIEDEKIQKEERDKTRDVFARIEGLDKVRQVALPKPSRILVEERQYGANSSSSPLKTGSPPPAALNAKGGVKGKSSFKRLSDVLSTGKKDLWLVVFNDVVLLCQRTGTTSLPLVSATNSRTNSLPEFQGKSKYASSGRRASHTKPRNLYKFIKIETWAIGDVVQPREGVISMEDVARSRAQVGKQQPKIVPLPDDDEEEDDGIESDDSDRKSKMSFSYWGADKVTVQKPLIKPRAPVRRGGGPGAPSYARESSANAKFGTRLVVSPDPHRPASRRAAPTPTSKLRPVNNDDTKSTVTRPGWNSNTSARPAAASPPPNKQRSRNTSQTSATPSAARTPAAKAMTSPAPSEDSGVGFYRQIHMLANDSSPALKE